MAPTLSISKKWLSSIGKSGPRIPGNWKSSSVDPTARPLGSLVVRLNAALESVNKLEKVNKTSLEALIRQAGNGAVRLCQGHVGGTEGEDSTLVNKEVPTLIMDLNNCFVEGRDILERVYLNSGNIVKRYESFTATYGYLEKEAISRTQGQNESLCKELKDLEEYLPELQGHADNIQSKIRDLYGMVGHNAKKHLERSKDGKALYRKLNLGKWAQAGIIAAGPSLGFMKAEWFGAGVGFGISTLTGALSWVVSDKNKDFRDTVVKLRMTCDGVLDVIRLTQALKHAAQDLHDRLKGLLSHMKQATPFSERFTIMAQKPEVASTIWKRIHRAVTVYKDECANLVKGSIKEPKEAPLQDPSSEDSEPMAVESTLFSSKQLQW